ncbi:secondary thiamine-phosphate synthase enzyme YjbQ [Candidatus Woesearchaeota archaeon]|nr:secondary thiamine-phosphate synthase enzyme YjbQ [Candidatus Woesearchaeota archaeon]MBW3021793.1 secondary thiamine-phosphate synthase enzyme YjbQ [Candidatus Woesearchaeota archaeon]
MVEISINTNSKEELVDITSEVQKNIKINNGICIIYTPHTTAAVTINENADPDVKSDILKGLKSLNLENQNFQHAEGNSPGHMKSSLFGCSLTVPVENRRLKLGNWQAIFFCEFDGPRNRKVIVKTLEG